MRQINNFLDQIATNKKYHFWMFFCILTFLTLAMMLLYRPLCPGHDFYFHYRRLQALIDGLNNGPFLIYLDYSAVDGYGYFTKAFYCDVVLIPFAIIGKFTSLKLAYLFLIFTMTVLCGVFTYRAVNTIYKNSYAAAISALLYTFCAYRILDIYDRAAIGEAISFTFIPIVFLGFYHIIKGDYRKWYILAIGFSLMIFTHLISSVLMLITIFIYLGIYCKSILKEPKRIFYLLLSGIVILLVTSYYILPMFEQMQSDIFYYESRQLTVRAQDSTYDLHWIIWGMFSGIIHPYQMFIPGIGLFLTCAITLRLFVYGKSAQLKSVDVGVIVGLVYVFATSSLFPWSIYPFKLLNFIQLPSRLYEFSSFFFAIAGGCYLSQLLKTNRRLLSGGLLVVVATLIFFLSNSAFYQIVRCNRPVTQAADITNDYHLGGLEYFPDKVPSIKYIDERGQVVIPKYAETVIDDLNKEKGVTNFNVLTSKEELLELPLIYYKGYLARLNEKDLLVSESKNGLVQVSVNESGNVKVHYGGTTVQRIGWFISFFSILSFCIYIFLFRNKDKV